ncbi:hypothetical protein V0288_24030 [Pannus brasiliensis CCIBt3594]|uniref:Uncharacterized protein n=1 Tax=Pannus brasiliensis CCIBt3594 TaxID=1427578 RepID=A0AAW9QT16_9CHRO
MKYFVGIILVLSVNFWMVPPASADFCRAYQGREICILRIQRSAKNYREYRAVVKVDGVKRSLETYDCRQKIRVSRSGEIVPFTEDSTGESICQVLEKNVD